MCSIARVQCIINRLTESFYPDAVYTCGYADHDTDDRNSPNVILIYSIFYPDTDVQILILIRRQGMAALLGHLF